jgi:hypothetical protein
MKKLMETEMKLNRLMEEKDHKGEIHNEKTEKSKQEYIKFLESKQKSKYSSKREQILKRLKGDM